MRRSPSIGRAEKRAPRTRLEGDSRARGGRVDRSSGRIRPLFRSNSTALQVESTSANGRVDHSVVASRRVSRGDSTPHGVHSPGRVGARGVDSARRGAAVDSARRGDRGGGRLARASRPPPLPVPPPLPLQALPRVLSWVLGDVSLFLSELTFGDAPESFGEVSFIRRN